MLGSLTLRFAHPPARLDEQAALGPPRDDDEGRGIRGQRDHKDRPDADPLQELVVAQGSRPNEGPQGAEHDEQGPDAESQQRGAPAAPEVGREREGHGKVERR